jgi:Fic-DOC domain mobile mystery protein B
MGLIFNASDGQTPLEEEETRGLRIASIATRAELDEFEQLNIEKAVQWMMGRSFRPETVFTEEFVRRLHQRMFGDVWNWAGAFRSTNKNLGLNHWEIAVALRQLLDDVRYWQAHQTYLPDETALRFKHRVVSIHCFANGNGRHSRLLADIMVEKVYGLPVFTWGAADLSGAGSVRAAYLRAVKAADRGDYGPLLAFARS